MEDRNFKRYCGYSSNVERWFGAEYLFAGLNQIQNLNGIGGNFLNFLNII